MTEDVLHKQVMPEKGRLCGTSPGKAAQQLVHAADVCEVNPE